MVPLRVERWREQPPLLGGVHLIGGGEAVALGWLIRNMGRPAVRESIGTDQGRIDAQDTDHLVVGTVARHNQIVPRDGFVSYAGKSRNDGKWALAMPPRPHPPVLGATTKSLSW
jgi:hypothetical protein